jgi:hypothetical protein
MAPSGTFRSQYGTKWHLCGTFFLDYFLCLNIVSCELKIKHKVK